MDDPDDLISLAFEIILGGVILAFDVLFALVYACICIGCWILGFGDDD